MVLIACCCNSVVGGVVKLFSLCLWFIEYV